MDAKDLENVVVVIDHPYGSLEISLAEWARRGPGERRLLRPIEARDRTTGERLPLSVIPIHLRNTLLSRGLIRLGVLPDPWPETGRSGKSQE